VCWNITRVSLWFVHSFIHSLGPSINAPDAPQPWAYCAKVCGYCETCISCKERQGPTYRQDHWCTARIIAAVKDIDAPMMTRVWQELEYRIDVCRVTRGAHIEHL
jgi:hypothetical protein